MARDRSDGSLVGRGGFTRVDLDGETLELASYDADRGRLRDPRVERGQRAWHRHRRAARSPQRCRPLRRGGGRSVATRSVATRRRAPPRCSPRTSAAPPRRRGPPRPPDVAHPQRAAPGLGPAADGAGSSRRGEAPMCPRRFSCDGGLTTARAALQFEGVATRRDGTRNGVEVTWAATQARLIRRCRHRAGPAARRRPLMGPSGWMRTPRGCPLVVMAREAVHPSRQRRKRRGRLKVVSHLQSQCPTSHSARWTSSCRSARGAGNYREPAIPPAAADRRTR